MSNIKDKLKKLINKLKQIFRKKENKIILLVILIVVFIVLLIAIFSNKDKGKFALNGIYDVYPEEVKELYKNMVSVSCYGDLYLDVSLDSEALMINEIELNNLMDYMFSYLDKQGKLTDSMDKKIISTASSKLFKDDVNFEGIINGYGYGEYQYYVEDDKILRSRRECIAEKEYISFLDGYTYSVNELSIDIDFGYLDDGVIYDLLGNKLGKYDGDINKLGDIFKSKINNQYRYNFVLDDGTFKLSSIEWKSKI